MKRKRQAQRRRDPKLTENDVRNLLQTAKETDEQDWLILRLIAEHDFKVGEVVGNRRTGNIPALTISDLGDDFIWFHRRPENKRYVHPQLVRLIRDFAKRHGRESRESRVFDATDEHIRYATKYVYAKKAQITDWRYVNPDSLKNFLGSKPPQFLLDLRKWFDTDIGNAEKMADFYIANYCLENSIRRLIRETLKKYGEDWWEIKVPEEVRKAVELRKEHERNSTLSEREDDLAYTMLRELSAILKKNWSDFSTEIRKTLSVVEDLLLDLNELRNVIAHSCQLDKIGMSRHETSVRTWLGVTGTSPTPTFE